MEKPKKRITLPKNTDMKQKDLKKIFQRAPIDEEGYVMSFPVDQPEEYLEFLHKYGFCVVRILSEAECDSTVRDMFAELNQLAASTQKKKLSPADPSSWETENWPSSSKFCVKEVALSQKAFDNRTHPNLYQVYSAIYGRKELYATIDVWGIMRGTKDLIINGEKVDRPEWRQELSPHWDISPWEYVRSLQRGEPARYQSILALVDCPKEVGGHMTLPCSTPYLPIWCSKVKEPSLEFRSHHVSQTDPLVSVMQKIPLRKGDLIVWDAGQLHCNFHNESSKMRLVQHVRMLPATRHTLQSYPMAAPLHCDAKATSHLQLSDLGRKLLGLTPWSNANEQ